MASIEQRARIVVQHRYLDYLRYSTLEHAALVSGDFSGARHYEGRAWECRCRAGDAVFILAGQPRPTIWWAGA